MGGASVDQEGRALGRPPAFEEAADVVLRAYDWRGDAFGGPPFVPQPAAAELLMAVGLRTGKPLALKAALRSLSVLPKSELADPVEGGFFDGCREARWRAPHTRKSLATNAALLRATATAAAWTQEAALRRAAAETAAFIDGTLKSAEGDLWSAGQGPDDEYFERMGHARGQRGAPPVEGTAPAEANAAAAAAFARAGVCLEDPRLIARARLALRELCDLRLAEGAPEELARRAAAYELFLATGEDRWQELAGAGETTPPMAAQGGPDILDGIATRGYRLLAQDAPRVEVRWSGPPVASAGGACARAALALAWALGPPALSVEEDPPKEGRVAFACAGRVSGATSDLQEVKQRLRGAIALKEGL
jgi:hypothetical protein